MKKIIYCIMFISLLYISSFSSLLGNRILEDTVPVSGISDLSADLIVADLTLSGNGNNTINYKYEDDNASTFNISKRNSLIYIKEEKKSFFGPISGKNKFFYVSLENSLNSFDFSMTTSDLIVENISVEKISGKITTGDLKISSLISDNSDIKTTTGSIEVYKSDFENLRLETTTGRISTEQINTEYLYLRSTTGRIYANLSNTPEEIYIKATTGSITLELPDINLYSIECTATTGRIEVGNYSVKKHFYKDGGKYKLKIETTTGNIKIK